MLQANISVRSKATFYIRVDMDCIEFSNSVNKALINEANLNGFINIIDEDGEIYMIRASEITDILIFKLSEGDDELCLKTNCESTTVINSEENLE